MKFRSLLTAICVLATANIVSAAPFAYVANSGTHTVSVIDTADNSIKTTVNLPDSGSIRPYAYGVAVGASGQFAYVGLQDTNEVVVIDTATNLVVKRIGLGTDSPGGLAVNAAETRLYVASVKSNTLIIVDISGKGAAEVGRVTVSDSSISNPEGVVLSPDGIKAYVANSTQGTVAEIALDETSNIYTRSALISLGNNAQPMGLTINSTGATLYVASLNGKASMVDTATRIVTELPLVTGPTGNESANGNVSVAITHDNSKIFAPSNSSDKIYVIDGTANTVSATTYLATAGPFGSSVTPDGTKLFLTMNTATAGETVQVFDTGNLSTAPAVISLSPGAKPTSFGSFIGPVFPFTITSTPNPNCGIEPSGTIQVNSLGRTFDIKPATQSTVCSVTVDAGTAGAVTVGSPTAYTFSNVAANHTITAAELTGTYYTLSGDWLASNGGYLTSTPAGIGASSKSAKFLAGTVTLTAPAGFLAGSWTGDCLGTLTGICSINMNADKTFGATITKTHFTLTNTGWVPAASGYLVSTPAGIDATHQSAMFPIGSTITVKANSGYAASAWTGSCAGTVGDTCILSSMAADKPFGATVTQAGGLVFNVTKTAYYPSIAAATAAAANGDEIRVSTGIASDVTTGTGGVFVKLSSQWQGPSCTQASGTYAALALTITDAGVIADGLIL